MNRMLLPLLLLLTSACAGVTSPDGETYTGLYSSGFETVSFRPCGGDESWWVTEGADLNARYRALGAKDYEEVYVEIRGETTPRGKYGHMGAYTREIAVREVIEIRPARAGECGKR